jgi:hypothetical protein
MNMNQYILSHLVLFLVVYNVIGWHPSTCSGELPTPLPVMCMPSVRNYPCAAAAFLVSLSLIFSSLVYYRNDHLNYRPRVPGTCPKRMAEIMKKCWSSNASFRPEAKDLDMIFADMSTHDAEPLIEQGNTRLRTEVAAGDMLYKVFPKKVADQLKAGQKVEP